MIWKRGEIYYLACVVNKKRISKSLGTGDRGEAKRRAKAYVDAARSGEWDKLKGVDRQAECATLGEIFAAYRAAVPVLGVSAGAAENYIRSLSLIVRVGLGLQPAADVCGQSGSVVTGDLAERYQAAMLDGAVNRERAQRSIRSTWVQARALFSRRALRRAYKDLVIPDMRSFSEAEIDGAPDDPVLPDDALWRRTLDQAEAWCVAGSPLYAVFLLEYNLAMRRCEAVAARWDWITMEGAQGGESKRVISIPQTKTKHPKTLEVTDDIWERLQTYRNDGEYILPGASKTARMKLAGREFSKALRAIGFGTSIFTKTGHTLRKMIGSVVLMKHGIVAAQAYLGHKDIRTTQKWYARYLGLPPAMGADAGRPPGVPFAGN